MRHSKSSLAPASVWRWPTCSCVALAAVQLASQALAQPAPNRAPETSPGAVPGVAAPAGAPGTAQESAAQRRLQELLRQGFDRRPASILKALSMLPEREAATNEVVRFQNDVVAGNWEGAGQFLHTLPLEHAQQVYRHLLQELQKAPGAGGPPGSPPQPPQQQPPGMPPPPPTSLLPGDVVALADVAPGDLSVEQAETLGRMLAQTLARGVYLEPLLDKLEAGTKQLGGEDPRKRELAANFLLAAGRADDALRFVAPLEVALGAKDARAVNLHARALAARAQPPSAAPLEPLTQAWDLTQRVLSWTNAGPQQSEVALQRALELIPRIQRDVGQEWVRNTFRDNPAQARSLVAAAGGLLAQGFSLPSIETRQRNLLLVRQVVEVLLAEAGTQIGQWRESLDVLTLAWIQEADLSVQRHAANPQPMHVQYDPYGNPIYYGPGGPNPPNQPPTVSPQQILAAAPHQGWIDALSPGLAPRVHATIAQLQMKLEDAAGALRSIAVVAQVQPAAASNLGNELLRVWARSRNPNQAGGMNPYGPMYYNPYGMQPRGIPLTRAKQGRNLKELAALLAGLRQIHLPGLETKLIVSAFAAAHSAAEVFLVEDIEGVFGPVERLDPEPLAEILQSMRQRLAGQWRQPRVQQQAQTQRKGKEIEAEVARGYDLILTLADSAIERSPDDWRVRLAHGAAWFDSAEFDYGRKVDLAAYTAKRDRALRSFREAAGIYGRWVAALAESLESPLVYVQWFNTTLGASDLAYITRQQEPSTNHLDEIRAAMLSLGGLAAERHLAAFGKSISESLQSIRPELKPRYARAATRVAGGHPSIAEVAKLARHYDDLLEEVLLHLEVDGDAAVGHSQPFGVFVSIRHSEAVGREAGGFGRYLQNPQANVYYYNPYGRPPTNYRDEFEKQVREKLGEGFEVLSVVFHDDKVQARGFGRHGWGETPYAYLLLKAKDGAVDRIPPLQIDMDFFDPRGQAVLPVASQTLLLDARPAAVGPRPADALEILQILDDRELASGKLTLEIQASARGLVPALQELLELDFAGLKAVQTNDQGLAVTKLDSEGSELTALSTRNWLIELAAVPPVGAEFRFAASKYSAATLAYKRYADADLVEVPAVIAIAAPTGAGPRFGRTVGVVAAAVAVAAALFLIWRRKPEAGAGAREPVHAMPGEVTPFSVIALLKRIEADPRARLSGGARNQLSRTIHELERDYFARPTNGSPAHDLERVARDWVARA